MAKKPGTGIAKVGNTQTEIQVAEGLVPLSDVPDYLRDTTSTGMESLDTGDFKIPRIKLLQPLSPEIRQNPGVAIPGQFWHTAAGLSLGSEFTFVPAIATKRVILFEPRDTMSGGILAFSKDGKKWDTGGNQKFEVLVKGKGKVIWNTRENVATSRLCEFGTSNPDDPRSAPAATYFYEYLCFLPEAPELSPCLLGCYKTALNSAKNLNSTLLMLRKPIMSIAVNCKATEMQDGNNVWHIPTFKAAGYVSQDVYNHAKELGEKYKDYAIDYTQEDAAENTKPKDPNMKLDDSIPF